MNKLRIAVIGAGHLGRFHAKLLATTEDVDLIGVVDPLPGARENVATECGTAGFADYRELIGRMDAAIVATPTRYHHQVAMDLLRRRIPVLVEKPLADSIERCEDLATVARRSNTILQVGHIERFNPAFVAAAPYLREARYIEAVRAAGFTFRSIDIGVVLDLMIHDLDLAMALAGAPVTDVRAMGLAVVGKHEDVANARIEFENGCVANLSASRVSPVLSRRMQVWAQHAYATVDFGLRAATVIRPSESILRRQIDVNAMTDEARIHLKDQLTSEHLPLEPLDVENRNAMQDEQRDFIDSVRRGTQPKVTGEAGRDVVAVAERILEQIDRHRWSGQPNGPVGPLATPPLPILRGPHWTKTPAETEVRRAG